MKIRMIGQRSVAPNGVHVQTWEDGSIHDVTTEHGESLIKAEWAEAADEADDADTNVDADDDAGDDEGTDESGDGGGEADDAGDGRETKVVSPSETAVVKKPKGPKKPKGDQ